MTAALAPTSVECSAGGMAEWEQLYRTHHASLLGWLSAVLLDDDAAQDVAQDAFWRVRKSRPLTREVLFKTANRLASNAKRSWVRRHRRSRNVQIAEHQMMCRRPETADALIEAQELSASVQCFLARLPENDRRVIQMWAEGFAREEIAVCLCISERTVRLRAERGRRRLREMASDRPVDGHDSY